MIKTRSCACLPLYLRRHGGMKLRLGGNLTASGMLIPKDPSPKARDPCMHCRFGRQEFDFVIPVHPEFSGFLKSQSHLFKGKMGPL